MPEDRSLDEFATPGGEDGAPAGEDDPAADAPAADDAVVDAQPDADPEGDADADDSAPAPDAVAPAEATYDHSPDGAACAVCGGTTTRRWRDDPGYVCADCKEW
ncbi:DUF7573 domain-containing protein [Halobaculum litoreum]|uniref:DUF7573 domain-containing protein n=1 Tax=Halobaculum litoreum TaxID=3031998 RepID=A0ABD5XU78_9EURY|nr:hypothetical protein [Halobaculum sp. DT92]